MMNTCYSDVPQVIAQALFNAYEALEPGNYTAVLSTNNEYSRFTHAETIVLSMMTDTSAVTDITNCLKILVAKHGRPSLATMYWDDASWDYTVTFLF